MSDHRGFRAGTLRHVALLLGLPLLLSSVGCEMSKTSNPLSPTVAGPIPGVNISAPTPVEPAVGAKVAVDRQPITLTVVNSTSSGVRPLSYLFEVASDVDFTNKMFVRSGIAPGEGRTSLRLPDPLATGRNYYWRGRAEDGANTGPYSGPVNFSVFTPIVIAQPGPIEPINNVVTATLHPHFAFINAPRSGPVGAVAYVVEVSETDSFADRVATWWVDEQPNQTGFDSPQNFAYSKQYFWRVAAYDPSTTGPWSATQVFQTPTQVVSPPPGGGGGGGGGGDWQSCAGRVTDDLVACVVDAVDPPNTVEGAFEVTKRVAWLLRGEGAGELIKNGGENIVSWRGYSFAAARICYPDGHIYKVLSDVPTTNGPSWQDNGYVDRSLYVPAIDPSLP
jgi:hypothetical protein